MTDFEAKRLSLVEMLGDLHTTLIRLFPAGGPITWRCENSHNETGTVMQHVGRGRIRVVDGLAGFSSTITIDDIVRATP